ncbi:unnamed protein product [Prorocentrum cordatum]|uniref:Integrase catalytic domain-containing protein n=1 Tax=Prorocentrum cordatum TaxID=2364126 RepID=A0ABN9XWD9_9DINO|nr:unnamed protein product [Polarella glacialis]
MDCAASVDPDVASLTGDSLKNLLDLNNSISVITAQGDLAEFADEDGAKKLITVLEQSGFSKSDFRELPRTYDAFYQEMQLQTRGGPRDTNLGMCVIGMFVGISGWQQTDNSSTITIQYADPRGTTANPVVGPGLPRSASPRAGFASELETSVEIYMTTEIEIPQVEEIMFGESGRRTSICVEDLGVYDKELIRIDEPAATEEVVLANITYHSDHESMSIFRKPTLQRIEKLMKDYAVRGVAGAATHELAYRTDPTKCGLGRAIDESEAAPVRQRKVTREFCVRSDLIDIQIAEAEGSVKHIVSATGRITATHDDQGQPADVADVWKGCSCFSKPPEAVRRLKTFGVTAEVLDVVDKLEVLDVSGTRQTYDGTLMVMVIIVDDSSFIVIVPTSAVRSVSGVEALTCFTQGWVERTIDFLKDHCQKVNREIQITKKNDPTIWKATLANTCNNQIKRKSFIPYHYVIGRTRHQSYCGVPILVTPEQFRHASRAESGMIESQNLVKQLARRDRKRLFMEDIDLDRQRMNQRKELKGTRYESQHAPVDDANNDDEDLAVYIRNQTHDASLARRTEKARSKQPLAKKGKELRHLHAEWKSTFNASDEAEWEKWIKYDTVGFPTNECLKAIDPSEVLPKRKLHTDKNEATNGSISYDYHPLQAKTRNTVPGYKDKQLLTGELKTNAPTRTDAATAIILQETASNPDWTLEQRDAGLAFLNGRRLDETSRISCTQKEHAEIIERIPLGATRRKQKESKITADERQAMHRVDGQVQWLVRPTKMDLAFNLAGFNILTADHENDKFDRGEPAKAVAETRHQPKGERGEHYRAKYPKRVGPARQQYVTDGYTYYNRGVGRRRTTPAKFCTIEDMVDRHRLGAAHRRRQLPELLEKPTTVFAPAEEGLIEWRDDVMQGQTLAGGSGKRLDTDGPSSVALQAERAAKSKTTDVKQHVYDKETVKPTENHPILDQDTCEHGPEWLTTQGSNQCKSKVQGASPSVERPGHTRVG